MWLSVVEFLLQLDGLNQVIHIQEVTAKISFCSLIRVDGPALLLSRQEFLDELNFINREGTLQGLVNLRNLEMSSYELPQIKAL